MIGVTVKLKGTQAATVTDLDGNFVLNASSKGGQLEFSYIGYKIKTVPVGNGKVKVTMEPDSQVMDEVVVIGYGSQKKKDLTGAVSSVKSEDIKKAPVMNAMEGLQGRISGLDITRTSGQAGSSPEILLRGNRSLNASCAPLFVIDGIAGGNIDDINPNDIETIDVLKDASSTAIYGAAGANGVIIVTTRQGVTGKVTVDFNGYVGINAFPSYPETYTGQEWINYITEGFVAREGREPKDIEELFNVAGLSAGAVEAYNAGKWINWRDEILQTGMQQNYSLSVHGGTEQQQSYMSAGYQQEKGLYKNDVMDQITFRAGTTYNVNKIVSIGFQSTITYRNQNKRNSRLSKSLNYLPLGDVYNEDGSLKQRPIDDMNSYINIMADDQPNAYENNTKRTNVSIAPFVEIKPIKGLTVKSLFSANLGHSRGGLWDGLDTFMKLSGSSDNKRISTYDSSNSWSYTWQNVATYNFKVAQDHDFTITGITEFSKSKNERALAQNEQFEFDGFKWYHLEGGLKPYASSSYRETTKMSYAMRGSYNYLGKYLLSASVRWDGASQLYNKWCAFPAVSAGWRISDEKFMTGTRNWLDNLKLRVGYGVTGNANISPYVTTTEVTNSANYLNLGSGRVQTYILTQNVANNELTWEKSYNWNFGLDFAVLGSRIDGSIEYYTTDTKGVLYNRPLPTALGLYNAKATYYKMSNIARIKNRGVEVTINSRNIETKNFQWNSTLTFSKNVERLKEINLGNNITTTELIALNLFMDNPVNTFYGYKKAGIWQLGQEEQAACFGSEPGDVHIDVPGLVWDPNYTYEGTETVKGENGEDVTTPKNYTGAYYKEDENGEREYFTRLHTYGVSSNDKQILGSKTPDWTLGFSNQFTYKNFDLSIMCSMRWGQMINGELLTYMDNTNQPVCYDYWTPTNPTNAYPRHEFGANLTTAQKEAMGFVDGSFFKVKNITLGYNLPKGLLKKVQMSKFRIYATIQNPFIWSKSDMLKGMDPENNASDKFPLYKTIVFGVNASF